jgi:hypothetical protein
MREVVVGTARKSAPLPTLQCASRERQNFTVGGRFTSSATVNVSIGLLLR